MDGQEQTVESAAPVEVQREAESMGWIPPTRFKGDPARFVDADEYLRRGQEVLPIVRESNKRLQHQLTSVQTQLAAQTAALKAAQDAIALMEERHSVETVKAVEKARRDVKEQLAAASEAGDHQGVAELTDQLTQLREVEQAAAAAAKAKPTPVAEPSPAAFVPSDEQVQWNRENPWFGTDRRKTALAIAAAEELRQNGETSQGRVFFDKVAAEVAKVFGGAAQEAVGDKVASGAGRSAASTGTARGKSYASMPAEAREACDSDARRFVGPGKKYAKIEDWRSRYAEMYFGE